MRIQERKTKTPRFVPSQSHPRESGYLRMLKRRQRTSLWLERLAWGAIVVALVCFLAEQVTEASLAWWLGIGCLLFALVLVVIETLDAASERQWRDTQRRTQSSPHYEDERASHQELGKQEQADDSS